MRVHACVSVFLRERSVGKRRVLGCAGDESIPAPSTVATRRRVEALPAAEGEGEEGAAGVVQAEGRPGQEGGGGGGGGRGKGFLGRRSQPRGLARRLCLQFTRRRHQVSTSLAPTVGCVQEPAAPQTAGKRSQQEEQPQAGASAAAAAAAAAEQHQEEPAAPTPALPDDQMLRVSEAAQHEGLRQRSRVALRWQAGVDAARPAALPSPACPPANSRVCSFCLPESPGPTTHPQSPPRFSAPRHSQAL